jgi:hypothetical protein
MQASEIHDYASRLLKDHADKAQLIAAQRAVECEKRGDQSEAQDWRRIGDALKEICKPLLRLRQIHACPSGMRTPISNSDVVVEKELVGMRAETNFVDLTRPLIVEVGFNHVLRENVPSEKEVMILLKRVERFL